MNYILVADDDAATREVLSLALTEEGYEVQTTPDGAAALSAAVERQPALILLNAHMPIMDGAAFARAYHQAPGPHAPIIALSADGHAIGTDSTLSKPFDLTELLELVSQYTSPGKRSWIAVPDLS